MAMKLVFAVLAVLSFAYANAQPPPDLRSELEAMYDADQGPARSGEIDAQSPQFAAAIQQQQSRDEANLLRLKTIIATHGWPARTRLGDKAARTAFLVIQHADEATQEAYLPLLRAAVDAGEARADDLALLEDRILVRQGKLQRYGSQLRSADGVLEFYPIDDEAHVDARRKSVGLPPLAEYARQLGLKYPAK